MKKLSYIFCALVLLSQPVNAQFDLNDTSTEDSKAVLSLSEGIVQQQTSTPSSTAATAATGSLTSEDKGIFSFMDFSFLKEDGLKPPSRIWMFLRRRFPYSP